MTAERDFAAALLTRLEAEAANRYADNSVQWYAYGNRQAYYMDLLALEKITPAAEREILAAAKKRTPEMAAAMAPLYARLADDASRETLLTVAAYRILQRRHVKFPYYRTDAIEQREMLAARTRVPDPADKKDLLDAARREWGMFFGRYNLFGEGRDLAVYSTPETLYMEHFQPAYTYAGGGVSVTVTPGDTVIDCGAGLGDQAVFFADKAGDGGLVVCLEPHPINSKICYENMVANPRLKGRLMVLPVGAWRENAVLGLSGEGASSSVTGEGGAHTIRCRTVDAVAADLPGRTVSFLKMDIEGAETEALKGAAETLARNRPKIALSIYHDHTHFAALPAFLDAVAPGYALYLGHHSISEADTVLYGIA